MSSRHNCSYTPASTTSTLMNVKTFFNFNTIGYARQLYFTSWRNPHFDMIPFLPPTLQLRSVSYQIPQSCKSIFVQTPRKEISWFLTAIFLFPPCIFPSPSGSKLTKLCGTSLEAQSIHASNMSTYLTARTGTCQKQLDVLSPSERKIANQQFSFLPWTSRMVPFCSGTPQSAQSEFMISTISQIRPAFTAMWRN